MPLPTRDKKEYARRKVRTEIEAGRMHKSSLCQRCGSPGVPSSDGRSTIHAHHHDYDNPTDVEWLCAACHRKETPLPEVMGAPSFGEANGQSKFTFDKVAEARDMREKGATLATIARRFGLSVSATHSAVTGETWIAARKAGG